MESLFVKCTQTYICFHSLLRLREEWNKGQLFKGEKRLRTTALKDDDSIFNQSDSILNQILNKPWLKSKMLKRHSRILIEFTQSQVYSSFIQINIYSKASKYTCYGKFLFNFKLVRSVRAFSVTLVSALSARRFTWLLRFVCVLTVCGGRQLVSGFVWKRVYFGLTDDNDEVI